MKKFLLPLIIILIFAAGLLAAYLLTKQSQDIRNKAAVTGGVGSVSLNPSVVTKYPGDVFPVVIKAKTASAAVSSIALRITYPYTATVPELDVVDSNGNPTNQISPEVSLLTTGDWTFPVKSVTRANNMVTIDIAGINTSLAGFVATSDVNFATIYFKVNSGASVNPLALSFDTSQSKMLTKADPASDILNTPTNGAFTIISDSAAPAAVTNLAIAGKSLQSVNLSWTAPSDVGPAGKAASYEVRYSQNPLTDVSWGLAALATNLPIPANPGTVENLTVTGLSANTAYYFALKSKDASGNVSSLSNVINVVTSSPTLSFGFKMQGIPVQGITKTVNVTVSGSTTQSYTVAFVSDTSGVFHPLQPINLTNITSNTSYDVFVKDSSHLKKKIGTMNLVNDTNVAPASWDNSVVKIGDFTNDNILSITDIGGILSVYTALSIPVTAANQIYDVNADNVINISDIALVLVNYTALQIPGD